MLGVGDRRFAAFLMAAYVLGLAILVTSPWGWELNRLTVRLCVVFRRDVPIAPDWMLPEHYGLLLNILLFVPLAGLASVFTGRAWWWVTLACLATSVLIEGVQWRWLERDGAWVDVVANTMGGLVGAVCVTLVRRARRPSAPRAVRPRRSRSLRPPPPT